MSRVWRLLPPRRHVGARSSSSTDSAWRRADSAATRPALPPPTTTTSYASGATAHLLRRCTRYGRHDLLGDHLHVLDPRGGPLGQAVNREPDPIEADALLRLEQRRHTLGGRAVDGPVLERSREVQRERHHRVLLHRPARVHGERLL